MNAAEIFIERKKHRAKLQHVARRLSCEHRIGKMAVELMRYADVVKAAVGTSPTVLAQACDCCRKLSDEMAILAEEVKMMARSEPDGEE